MEQDFVSKVFWEYHYLIEFDRYPVWYRYQVPIPSIGICMKKIGMNPVSFRYGRYGGYRYRFGIEDMDMGDIGIGNPVSYQFFNVISVSKSVWTQYRYHTNILVLVSVRYGGFWGYRFEYSPNRYRYIGIGQSLVIVE